VREQILSLQKEMNSPEFKARYGGFVDAYQQGSTVQNARTAMSDFNISAMELGKITLPAVNVALRDFKAVIEGLRGLLPGGDKDGKGTATVGARAIEGGLAGLATGGVAVRLAAPSAQPLARSVVACSAPLWDSWRDPPRRRTRIRSRPTI
jgi:hypothetical protein